MSSRKRFERWCKRHKLPVGRMQEVTRDGPRLAGYANFDTQLMWLGWEAAWRAKR